MFNVLVVEDDADARFLVADTFRSVGYDVREAEHGQGALDVLLSDWRPHVIVLDMAMPVMDGLTFLARMSEADVRPPIPVIIVSATARGPIEHASCVLAKPVDRDVLLRVVREHAG